MALGITVIQTLGGSNSPLTSSRKPKGPGALEGWQPRAFPSRESIKGLFVLWHCRKGLDQTKMHSLLIYELESRILNHKKKIKSTTQS
jgi:hypothetical protein